MHLKLYDALLTFRIKVFDQMQKGLAKMDLNLSMPQSICLQHIADANALTVSELQARTRRSQATTSHLVSQLETRGLVERRSDPQDGRRTLVTLSKGGKRFMQRIEQVRREGFERVLGNLSTSTLARLEAALLEAVEQLP